MANTFKNKLVAGVSAEAEIYPCPSATTATVIGVTIANVGSGTASVTVKIVDNDTSTTCSVVKDAPVPVGGSLSILENQKIVLEAGDSIRVASATSNSDVFVSVLQIT